MSIRFTLWLLVLISGVAVACYTPPKTTTFVLDVNPQPEETRIRSPWYHTYPVTAADIQCLALNIYFEARSDPTVGQYAVADVVMYRMMHYNFPDTICSVVKDGVFREWQQDMPVKWRCSFTWYCDRKSDVPTEKKAFGIAMYIARDVLFNPDYEPEVPYALYYHAEYVDPEWGFTFVAKRGTHLFYM